GLLRGHSLDVHRQAPRGRKGHQSARFEPGILEPRADAGSERTLQRAQRFGRQLLGSQLHQEVALLDGHATASTAGLANIGNPSASRLAKYACATALASART